MVAVSRSTRQPGAGARRPSATATVSAAALGVALLLSGCAAGMISQTAQQVAAIDGGNATVGTMAVRNVLLATPPAANYPPGAEIPVLAVLANDGFNPDALTAVSTPAGQVKLSPEKIVVPPRSLVQLTGEGPQGIKLSGGQRALCYGRSIPFTFSFEKAGQVTLNVTLQTPVTRTGTRTTIEILPAEPTPLWETGAHAAEASAAGEPSKAGGSGSAGASAAAGAACNT